VLLFVEPLGDGIMDVVCVCVGCQHPNSPSAINRHIKFRSKYMHSVRNKVLENIRGQLLSKNTKGLFERSGKEGKHSPHFINLPLFSNSPRVFFGGSWGFIALSVYFEEDWFQASNRRLLFCFSL
jgi:hypothetical protein